MKKFIIIIFIICFFGLFTTNATFIPSVLAMLNEKETQGEQGEAVYQDIAELPNEPGPLSQAPGTPGSNPQKPKTPEYAPGQLIVKLKQDKTLEDIRELNTKYNVTDIEKVFKDILSPEDKLKELKTKLSESSAKHDSWYWQLDKDSKEYKDYIAKLEKEKQGLQEQIKAQEELIAKLAERQKRAPEGATAPNLGNIYLLKTGQEANILVMAQDYSSNPNVEYAEPNYIAKIQMVPNDPYYSSRGSWGQSYDDLWGLKKINCEQAWDISQGEGVIVAVVDTGIDYNHEDLTEDTNDNEVLDAGEDQNNNGVLDSNIWTDASGKHGYDFVNNDNDPRDDNGHGTHVAGTIAALGNNSKGIIGVAPKTKVMAVKGLDRYGFGSSSNLAKCLYYAANNRACVINNSWGGYGNSQVIEDAVKYAWSSGCAVIVAAGNSTIDAVYAYPANISYAITVAASNEYSSKCSFSNYGTKIDVTAPGGTLNNRPGILSLLAADSYFSSSSSYANYVVGSKYIRLDGTSMASPHVAGLAALILAKNPDLKPEQIRYILRNTTDDILSSGWDIDSGYGRINSNKALSFTDNPPDLYSTITSPSVRLPWPNNVYNKGTITIRGSVFGAGFRNYEIQFAEYSKSVTPVFKTITSGTSMVYDGIVGEFDTSSLENGAYLLRLVAYNLSSSYTESRILIYIDSTLKEGWPKIVSYYKGWPSDWRSYELPQSLTFADLDKDGNKEIITIDGNKIYCWRADGNTFNSNFPITMPEGVSGIEAAPTIVDLNGDGNEEILVETYNKPTNPGVVYAFYNDGRLVSGFPAGRPMENIPSYVSRLGAPYPVATADLEGDGREDIITIFSTYNTNFPRIYLSVLESDGSTKPGWPVILSSSSCYPYTPISIADLDNDGQKEILVGIQDRDGARLVVYSYNGQVKDDIRFALETLRYEGPILIGDVNNDGKLGIFFQTHTNTGNYKMYLLDNELRFLSSWPKEPSSSNSIRLSYVFADIDGDLNSEIIGSSEWSLLAYLHDASIKPGFPKDINFFPYPYNNFNASPIITTRLDKSPNMAIFLSAARGGFYGFDNKVNLLENWPKFIPPSDVSGVVGDLDKNGVLEIGIHSLDGMVYIWQEAAGDDKTTPSSWPTLYGNNQRTNLYVKPLDTTPPTVSLTSPQPGAFVSGNITVTADASDNVGVVDVHFKVDGNDIESIGTIGSSGSEGYSDYWYTPSVTDGQHTLTVVAEDAAGHETTSDEVAVIVDNTAPTGSISINAGAIYTASINVTLNLSAIDTGSGIDQMQLSNDNANWSSPEAYATTKAWTLAVGDGPKTVYVKFKDNADNWSQAFSDTIVLETTPPATPQVIRSLYRRGQLSAAWNPSQDPESGIVEYQYKITQGSLEGLVIPGWDWTSAGTSTSIARTGIDLKKKKAYYFNVRARNGVGMVSGTGYSRIIFGNTSPVARIIAQPQTGNAPLTVQFSGSQSYDPDDDSIFYCWNFGDGTKSVGINTTHSYRNASLKPKTYNATLTVRDNRGATSSSTAIITVYPRPAPPPPPPPSRPKPKLRKR